MHGCHAATAATAIASQFSSRGSSSMESVSHEPGHCASLWGHLIYGDEGYPKLILTVEKMTKAPDISTYKEEDKELAHKFYAILSSYLRGR